MPEYGDIRYGNEMVPPRAKTTPFYWVGCPEQTSPECLGDRWSSTRKFGMTKAQKVYGLPCRKCTMQKAKTWFKLPPKKPHTGAFN